MKYFCLECVECRSHIRHRKILADPLNQQIRKTVQGIRIIVTIVDKYSTNMVVCGLFKVIAYQRIVSVDFIVFLVRLCQYTLHSNKIIHSCYEMMEQTFSSRKTFETTTNGYILIQRVDKINKTHRTLRARSIGSARSYQRYDEVQLKPKGRCAPQKWPRK